MDSIGRRAVRVTGARIEGRLDNQVVIALEIQRGEITCQMSTCIPCRDADTYLTLYSQTHATAKRVLRELGD